MPSTTSRPCSADEQDGASCHLEVGEELAKHFLGAGTLVVDRLGHARGEAVGEFQLGHGPDGGLVREIFDDAGIPDAVVEVDPTVQEQALAGHFDVVEDDEGVLLVEAGRQRPVERMRSGADALSRHRKMSPGVSTGMAKASA